MVYVGKNSDIGLLRAYVTISSVKILIYNQIMIMIYALNYNLKSYNFLLEMNIRFTISYSQLKKSKLYLLSHNFTEDRSAILQGKDFRKNNSHYNLWEPFNQI